MDLYNDDGSMATLVTSGTSWSAPVLVGSSMRGLAVACPSPSACFITADEGEDESSGETSAVLESTNQGQSWTTEETLSGTATSNYHLDLIDCPTVTSCYAAGDVSHGGGSSTGLIVETSDGTDWSQATLPPGAATAFDYLSCASASSCVASGSSGSVHGDLYSTNAGATWSVATLPGNFSPAAVSCTSGGTCLGLGYFGGSTDVHVVESTDGGARWAEITSHLDPAIYLVGLVCVNPQRCWIPTTSGIVATIDGGTEWFAQDYATELINSNPYVLACSSALDCWLVGNQGTLWETSDGGGLPPSTTTTFVVPTRPMVGQVVFLGALTGWVDYAQLPTGDVSFSLRGAPIEGCSRAPLEAAGSDQAVAYCAGQLTEPGVFFFGASFLGDSVLAASSGSSSIDVHTPGYRLWRATEASSTTGRLSRGLSAEPVKPSETPRHADLMSASGDGSLIQATVGNFGGVGRRWRKRAGLAA
jgi:photosystem II stability/assembly factor-like uncharacterized protein